MIGRHRTKRSKNDPCYSAEWSGVSYAPHCPDDCHCPDCNERLHLEGFDTHYCPYCDDFKHPSLKCSHR